MRGKTAYKAYQKGAQYGKFGDHVSQGGKVVKGIDGPIHIEGGIESDIMKEHGPEGEYILMQKQGYESFAEVPVNETTGYKEYSWLSKKLDNAWNSITGSNTYQAMDSLVGGYLPGGMQPGDETWREGMDRVWSDPIQKKLGLGEHDPTYQRNEALEKMLGSQIGSAITGQGEMEGFIGQQLDEQMTQFGVKRDMLSTASGKLDTQTTGVQQSMGQYGGARDQQKKTGLITDTSPALEAMETQGEMQMANIGAGRKDISSQRQMIGSQERGAQTQADIDIAQGKQRTQASLASMLSDYMTATGETIDEGYLDMFSDYQDGTFTSVEDYT